MIRQNRKAEKKRLVELITQSYTTHRSKWEVELFNEFMREHEIPKLVDDLMEGGAMMPPCKVGDTVYMLELDNKVVRAKAIGLEFYSGGANIYIKPPHKSMCKYQEPIESIGQYIFLTREEAEQALKERDGK